MNKIDQRVDDTLTGIKEDPEYPCMLVCLNDEGMRERLKKEFTQTHKEALQQALELVGEDKDWKGKTVEIFTHHEEVGYNQAKAEIREALQAKIESL
tara:strand:- start:516 stop:806 length:291 start_codon:yes stop_codon:yes gene_type:complete